MGPCVWSGCICCYSGMDLATCPPKTILCEGKGRFVCWEGDCCMANGKEQFPVGMIKEDGKVCKLGLPCCVQSLFKPEPTNLVAFGWDCLCIELKGQFPFGGDTPEPICAVYGAQCALKDGKPVFACCNPPYEPGAFQWVKEIQQTKVGSPPAAEEMAR